MPEFPVKAKVKCPNCPNTIFITVPDKIYIKPDLINVEPVVFTLEDLKNESSKILRDQQNNLIGTIDLKDFSFPTTCNDCNTTFSPKVNDLEFL